jgi:NAD(P)-dependent dehydrogenase (short-subunit alcohol dehydrogenase family)
MVDRFANTTAVVTGGARGIGRATAVRLADEGATVAILDLDGAGTAELPAAVSFRACDVTVESEVASAFAELGSRSGPVQVLVNNAGVNAYHDATKMTEDEWDAVFAIDLKAAWLCAKYALPQMIAGGVGAIVNVSSIHARLTAAGMFPYAAAKAGVLGLTRSLALDYARYGIRVNAVCPGWTRTRLIQEWFARQPNPDGAERSVLAAHPMGRIAAPEEIAAVIAFLASNDASAITGASIDADVGLGARYAT